MLEHFDLSDDLLIPQDGPLQLVPITGQKSGIYCEDGVTNYSKLFSLVIPTYNESQNIDSIVAQLVELLDQSLPNSYELIVVDDNSPDLTWKKALLLTQTMPQVRVMRRDKEKGLSSAIIRGWQVAKGEILGVIDADLQHPPQVLLKMLDAMKNEADLVVASRNVMGGGVSEWSLVRRILSRGAQILGLMLLPRVVGRVSDPMSGYFLVRRDAITGPCLNPAGYKILIELLGRGRIKTIAEVGYIFQERTSGKSKVTWRQYIDYIRHLLRLRFRGRISLTVLQKKFPLKRFVRFSIVGFSGVFVDMAIFYLLHTILGLPMTRSKILAGEAAILNNFIWNDAWTFGDISQRQRGLRTRLKRFIKFNLICLSGLVLNVLVLNIVYNIFFGQRWPYLANLIAIAVVTFWNFWLNLKLGWRVTEIK